MKWFVIGLGQGFLPGVVSVSLAFANSQYHFVSDDAFDCTVLTNDSGQVGTQATAHDL